MPHRVSPWFWVLLPIGVLIAPCVFCTIPLRLTTAPVDLPPGPPSIFLQPTHPPVNAGYEVEKCWQCNGTGWEPETNMLNPNYGLPKQRCSLCGGMGYVRVPH